jgi:ribosome-binding protein aMBF1 (putative translation factor)
MKTKRIIDANEILDSWDADDKEMQEMVRAAMGDMEVARLVYEARTKAGLTQSELAARIGTAQSVIARLEDANYKGHSLTMLQRIAAALDKRVEIRFLSSYKSGRKSGKTGLHERGTRS